MKKGTATKGRKPLTKRIVKPSVCQFCGGKGFIELDKIGLIITPCYNCEKGIAKAREIGIPEDRIVKGIADAKDSGTEPIDSGTR